MLPSEYRTAGAWESDTIVFQRKSKGLAQSLKTFYFTIFHVLSMRSSSVFRVFTARFPCAQRSRFCVHHSPTARVHRSQSVLHALTMRSPCVHRSFNIQTSVFTLPFGTPEWKGRIWLRSKHEKEPVHKSGRKLSYSIRNLIVKYNLYGLLTVKIHRKIQSTQQLDLFCGCLFIACIPNDRVLKVWSITYTHVNYRCLYSANY